MLPVSAAHASWRALGSAPHSCQEWSHAAHPEPAPLLLQLPRLHHPAACAALWALACSIAVIEQQAHTSQVGLPDLNPNVLC